MRFISYIFVSLSFIAFQTSYAQCPGGQTEINVLIVPDDYGSETTWEITHESGSPTYGSGGPYQDNNSTPISTDVCVPDNTIVTFTIYDGFGDGICCGYGMGSYTITVDGQTIATGGEFGSEESVTFLAPPVAIDASVTDIISPGDFIPDGSSHIVKATLLNAGTTTITSVDLNYSIDGGTPVVHPISGLNLTAFSSFEAIHGTQWQPATPGDYTIKVWASNINGGADQNTANDEYEMDITVYEEVVVPNIINSYLTGTPTYTTIANSSDGINHPRDLDFHTILAKRELWVVNKETENNGGTTVTISDAGMPGQTSELRQDGNAWHFMSLPTGIAFGDNTNFATSPGVLDANHNGGSFTGPSLWSSDPNIYAQPSGGNGSHLDMLHASPYSMGICHEVGNAYWVFDGHNGNIVRYDFVEDHGPGNDYHGDAIVRRYTEVTVQRDGNEVPSHLILDKETGWLYIVDNGNDRVIRMDINSGSIGGNLPLVNEQLAQYVWMTGATVETVVNTGLTQPSGIDIIHNRLIVSDHSNGDIIIYDISNMPATELGRIQTGSAGVQGIKIGPDGRIWYVNAQENTVMHIEPENVTSIEETPAEVQISLFPNPTTGLLAVHHSFDNSDRLTAIVYDILGEEVLSTTVPTGNQATFDFSELSGGVYMMVIDNGTEKVSKRFVVSK